MTQKKWGYKESSGKNNKVNGLTIEFLPPLNEITLGGVFMVT